MVGFLHRVTGRLSAANDYRKELAKHGLKGSMGQRGNLTNKFGFGAD